MPLSRASPPKTKKLKEKEMFGTLCGEEACSFQGLPYPNCCACPWTAPTAPARHLSALYASPKKNKN